MNRYLVSYDLRKKRDYGSMLTLLRDSGAVKILESVWLLNSNYGAGAIRDHLRTVIDNDDGVIVLPITVGAEWASYGALIEGTDWLKVNVAA